MMIAGIEREIDAVRYLKTTDNIDDLWLVVREFNNVNLLQAALLNKNLTSEIANFLWKRYWRSEVLGTPIGMEALVVALLKNSKVEHDKLVTSHFEEIYQYARSHSILKSGFDRVITKISFSEIKILSVTTVVEQILHSEDYTVAVSIARNDGIPIKELIQAAENDSAACRKVLNKIRREEVFAYARSVLGEGFDNTPDEWLWKINNWRWMDVHWY